MELPADLRRLAIGVAGGERRDIGLGEYWHLGKLSLEPILDRPAFAVEHPEREAQRPHILAAQRLLVAEAERLHGLESELADIEMDELPPGEAVILERIGVITRLGEIAGADLARVGDDEAARLPRSHIGPERLRIHRHHHVRPLPGPPPPP